MCRPAGLTHPQHFPENKIIELGVWVCVQVRVCLSDRRWDKPLDRASLSENSQRSCGVNEGTPAPALEGIGTGPKPSQTLHKAVGTEARKPIQKLDKTV